MSDNRAIKRVAIFGGGITAWSTAAALKRRIASIEVTVVSSPPAADALADRLVSSLPSIGEFHADIGLLPEDTIVRARSGLRIGTKFKGWAEGSPDYIHAYGTYGASVGGVAFHQFWLRDHRGHGQSFDSFAPVAPEAGYGLRLTVETYQQLMRDYSLHLGAQERRGEAAGTKLRGSDGFVEAVVLADGAQVTADLFVDCTGPQASVRSQLGNDFEDWGRWLLCDRMAVRLETAEASPNPLDEVVATTAGWNWRSSSPSATEIGSVYCSAHGGDHEGAVRIRQGRLSKPWQRNCVAIGDSAVAVEPLEWTNLHLAHSQIDRLVAMMPDSGFAPVELAEYNRQCNAEADRVRDFLCMHYLTARRPEPFWRDAAAVEPPPSLAHTLSLFAERGRLPYYEEETFARDCWLAVLIGQGYLPRRIDPLADSVEPQEAERALSSRHPHTAEVGASYRGTFLQMGQNAQS